MRRDSDQEAIGEKEQTMVDPIDPRPDPDDAHESADYGGVGDRVTGILRAAETAAQEIRAEAQEEAERVRQRATEDATARVEELTMNASRLREEAEDYARDIRLAVEAYATQHRRQAEEEARELVSEAERRATSIREGAQEVAQQLEEATRTRQEEIRAETRCLEAGRRGAMSGLRDIAVQIQDLLADEPRPEEPDDTLVDTLDPEHRRRLHRN